MATTHAELFKAALTTVLAQAQRAGRSHVEVVSGDLHRRVGGYPGANHRMPICCGVMRKAMRAGDEITAEPPKGKGASLAIRYRLPRLGAVAT